MLAGPPAKASRRDGVSSGWHLLSTRLAWQPMVLPLQPGEHRRRLAWHWQASMLVATFAQAKFQWLGHCLRERFQEVLALAQHDVLLAASQGLRSGDRLAAFLGALYVFTSARAKL